MLFVSLLQGFGLLPGKAASRSGSSASGVDATGKGDADVAVAEKPLSGATKAVINRASSKPAQAGRATPTASTPPSGTEESPRRQAVKKTAEKPSKTGGKASAESEGLSVKSKTGKVVAPTASKAVKSGGKAVPAPDIQVTESPAPLAKAKGARPGVATSTALAATPAPAPKTTPVSTPEKPAKAVKAAKKTAAEPPAKPVGAAKVQRGAVSGPAVEPKAAAAPSVVAESVVKSPAKVAVKPVSKLLTPQPGPTQSSSAQPAPLIAAPVPAPGAVPAVSRRGGRKAAAAPAPVPQPLPSHSPDAAKATFSNIPERVMTLPVHTPARKDPLLANNWKNKPADQLTDQEVLSMPDAEYMNDVQMAFFRHKLVALKDGILANAGETTEHLREDTVVVPDPADRATIEEEHALELRTRDRERKLLKKIEQSIARIDAGDYGYCDETGEPIGVGRLIARPTASLSLEAQQRRELKQKMFGD